MWELSPLRTFPKVKIICDGKEGNVWVTLIMEDVICSIWWCIFLFRNTSWYVVFPSFLLSILFLSSLPFTAFSPHIKVYVCFYSFCWTLNQYSLTSSNCAYIAQDITSLLPPTTVLDFQPLGALWQLQTRLCSNFWLLFLRRAHSTTPKATVGASVGGSFSYVDGFTQYKPHIEAMDRLLKVFKVPKHLQVPMP